MRKIRPEEETNLSKKLTTAQTLLVSFYYGSKPLAQKTVTPTARVRKGRKKLPCLTFVLEAWRKLGYTVPWEELKEAFSYRRSFEHLRPPALEVYVYCQARKPKTKVSQKVAPFKEGDKLTPIQRRNVGSLFKRVIGNCPSVKVGEEVALKRAGWCEQYGWTLEFEGRLGFFPARCFRKL